MQVSSLAPFPRSAAAAELNKLRPICLVYCNKRKWMKWMYTRYTNKKETGTPLHWPALTQRRAKAYYPPSLLYWLSPLLSSSQVRVRYDFFALMLVISPIAFDKCLLTYLYAATKRSHVYLLAASSFQVSRMQYNIKGKVVKVYRSWEMLLPHLIK